MPAYQQHLLRPHTYYGTGGSTAYFYAPASLAELQGALKAIAKSGLPAFIMGAGTNSLVMDEAWQGAVVSLENMSQVVVAGTMIRAEAGALNQQVVDAALTHSLSGLGWMHRLPGQLGATVRMNARCYGGEISQVVRVIHSIDWQGNLFRYENGPGETTVFRGYKDTIFMDNGQLIYAVEIALERGEPQAIQEKMLACERDRESRQQFLHPSCGCVFKNNYAPEVAVPSGLLLELAGVRGLSQGAAAVSPYHCNFVYNTGAATSTDILTLSLAMRERVWSVFGVWLAYEMEILGSIPAELAAAINEQRAPQYNHQRLAAAQKQFVKK